MSKKVSENRKLKTNVVQEIKEQIKNSSSMLVAKYHGLTVGNLQELKNNLKNSNGKMKVYKNRLFKIAIKGTEYESLGEKLSGPNIFVFGGDDEIAPFKVFDNFAKENEALKLEAGIYEGKVIGTDEVSEIAKLPSYEEALGMLANSLIAPLRYIGNGMNMLVEEGKIKGE